MEEGALEPSKDRIFIRQGLLQVHYFRNNSFFLRKRMKERTDEKYPIFMILCHAGQCEER